MASTALKAFKISEPSYFQRRPLARPPTTSAETASTPAHHAELLWFNTEKGFGFVRLSDGTDAFLHMSKLQAAGHSNLPEGAQLKVRIEVGHKGPQVSEMLSVSVAEDSSAVPSHTPNLIQEPALEEGPPREEESFGLVKRYDALKGFGFIRLEGGGNDVFVHATTLTRSGLTSLDAGQNVIIRYCQGQKGLEARSIRVV